MFSFRKHSLRRSHRTAKPLRWHYQLKETHSYPSYYNIYESPPRPYLSNLPPELHLSIMSQLDPTSSTCYGLSSKRIYPLHHSRHRHVGLYENTDGPPLAVLLNAWKGEDQVLDWESQRYMGRDRYREIDQHRKRGWPAGYPPVSLEEHDEIYMRKDERRSGSQRERRKLRRKPRFERLDIWFFGRRR